jgi:hypothetical protein
MYLYDIYRTCNNNPVDTNTNTAIDKSTDHGDDINPGIDPESETQNESQMSESNNYHKPNGPFFTCIFRF